MIKPEPGSWSELLAELQDERFGPYRQTAREKPQTPAQRVVKRKPVPHSVIQERRRELCVAIDGFYIDDAPQVGNVVPLRPERRAAA